MATSEPILIGNWLSISDVARRWGVSYDTIRREVLAGSLPSMKVASVRRIALRTVEARESEALQKKQAGAVRAVRKFSRPLTDFYPQYQ